MDVMTGRTFRVCPNVDSKSTVLSEGGGWLPIDDGLVAALILASRLVGYFPCAHFLLQCVQNLYKEKKKVGSVVS